MSRLLWNSIFDHLRELLDDLHAPLDEMCGIHGFDDVPFRKDFFEMLNIVR